MSQTPMRHARATKWQDTDFEIAPRPDRERDKVKEKDAATERQVGRRG